jgi:predicted dehydrogenase
VSARQRLRVGLVGCGRLAELGYLPALAGLEQVELVAVADPVAGRRDRIAAHASALRTRPRAHGSVGELVASGDVDALVIASPAVEHLCQAELAAKAGLPALVEKPPAPALDEAERLAALSPAPWIGFNRRFQHGAPLLGRLPAEGPLELELELDYRRRSWRPLMVNEEVLTDIAPHLVDLALMLSGVDGAQVSAARISHDRAQLDLDTGRGRARIRCASDRPHRERVRARGEGGRRLAASGTGGPVAALTSRLPGRAHPLVQSLRDQLGAFAEAIRGGSPGLLASAADGARVMRVIDEARRVAAATPAT